MPDYMSPFGALQCHCLKCYSVTVSSAMMSLFEALQRHCLECYDVTVSPILSNNKLLHEIARNCSQISRFYERSFSLYYNGLHKFLIPHRSESHT